MDINDLKIFLKVTETRTIMEAAQATNSSRPRVYRAMGRLEDELGVQLFDHQTQALTLTEFGKLLKEEAPKFLEALTDLQTKIEALRFKGNAIKIEACDPGPSWYMGREILFSSPDVDTTHNIYKDLSVALSLLRNDIVDFVISAEPIEEKGLTCQFMAHDQLLLSVKENDARFKDVRQISLQDGRIDNILHLQLDGEFSDRIKKAFTRASRCTKIVRETEYWELKSKLQRKNAITTSTRIVSTYRNDGDDRKLIPITDLGTSIDYYLVYKNSNKKKYAKIIELAKTWSEKFK